MEADALAYDELSKPQVDAGSQFIRELNLSQGYKVLDMGCGTGILTKYIADIVGSHGQVAGIDPDVARIKIAEEKYKAVRNIQYHVGDSVTGFPYDNEPYYDVHISTCVFHWVPNEEKKIYIQKAYQCLKSGGKLAIWCGEKMLNDVKKDITGFHPLTQEGYRDLFQAVGLFNDVTIDKIIEPFRFKSFAEFKRWYQASHHQELDDLDPAYFEKFITTESDGRVTWKLPAILITTCKN